MNLRISILLVVVLLLFGGAYLVIRLLDTGEPREREPWLYHIDESTIVHIEIALEGGEPVNFDRPPGSLDWVIQGDPDFPVFMHRWSGTPLLLSGPRVNRVLADKIEDLGDPASFGLGPPESVVRVSDHAGSTFEFHLGIPTPDGVNQYARLVGDDALFTLPAVWAQVVNRLASEPPWGRLYDLELETLRVVEVTHEDTMITYGLGPDGQWLIDGDPPQPVAEEWADGLALLKGPRIDQLLARQIKEPSEYGLEPPVTKVVLARAGAVPVEFHLGDFTPDGEHRYARVLNTGDTSLYAMVISRTDRIVELATDPPYGPETSEDS